MRAGSIFDPRYANGGTVCTGFYQWSNFYAKYRIPSCKIQIHLSNNVAANMRLTLLPSMDPAAASSQIVVPEQAYTRTAWLGHADSGRAMTKMKSYHSTRKFFPGYLKHDVQFAGNMYSSTTNSGSNPNIGWYWVLQWVNLDSENTYDFNVAMKITYYTELFERRARIGTSTIATDDNQEPGIPDGGPAVPEEIDYPV